MLQCQAVGDDGRIDPFNVVSFIDHRFLPGGFKIIFELNAERAIVVDSLESAVDVGALKDESAPFAKRDDFFERDFIFHEGIHSPGSSLFCKS
jgi:hypothetical protein